MNKDDRELTEQNVYKRRQDNAEVISVEEFLEWVNELKHNESI